MGGVRSGVRVLFRVRFFCAVSSDVPFIIAPLLSFLINFKMQVLRAFLLSFLCVAVAGKCQSGAVCTSTKGLGDSQTDCFGNPTNPGYTDTCTCSSGTARLDGSPVSIAPYGMLYPYQCCNDTMTMNVGPTCGKGCDQSLCTSPAVGGGHDW